MNPTTESAEGNTDGNTASDEAIALQQLQAAIAALGTAIESLNTATGIAAALHDLDGAKVLTRVSRQVREIKQIYTASLAMQKLKYIKFGPDDDTATPKSFKAQQ